MMFSNLSKLKNYKPHIPLYIENKHYILKTAENIDELKEIFKLRYSIFFEEFNKKRKAFNLLDIDKFDPLCDHLAIIDKKTNSFIGTYRLNSSLFSKQFYSSIEFDIKSILKLKGNKLELGRACIDKNYRNSFLVMLLWKGIYEYLQKTESKYLFGCSSIQTINSNEITRYFQYFIDNQFYNFNLAVYPRKKYEIKNFLKNNNENITFNNSDLPPLIRFYLKAGAIICGFPAIDKQFKCVDFFTFFNFENINPNVEKMFK